MNKDNDAEKLIIHPERIIPILLKHLMYLKNENAFLKNYTGIHSFENAGSDFVEYIKMFEDRFQQMAMGINSVSETESENNIGIKNFKDGILEKNSGIKTSKDDVSENNIGIKNFKDGIPEKNIGIKTSKDDMSEKNIGIKNVKDGIPENNIGIKNFKDGIPENNIGIKTSKDDISEKNIGIKNVFDMLSTIKGGANSDVLLYSVFEQGLIKALNQYIKTGDGQNTLYKYYTDFEDAVAEKNSATEKIKEAATNKSLEDTHILPAYIKADIASLTILKAALKGHLPSNAKVEMYENVAHELLLLHNAGKATGTQLRNFAGLTIPGFAKHLPKLKRYGLIEKQPPLNYVLTKISKHILLKTFGTQKSS